VTTPTTDSVPQPELTDGVVVLRPRREDDIEPARPAHDEEVDHWLVGFAIEHDGEVVGSVGIRAKGGGVGELSWTLYTGHHGHGHATRAVSMLADYAIEKLGMTRVEARVDPENARSLRVATRAGLRREGLVRGSQDRVGPTDHVLLGRLADDPPIGDPASFRSLLNSLLPRKRAISQMLVRDPDARVLLCQLTYKFDWDLPGGVVEVDESPQLAVSREIHEELGLDILAGSLLLTDWLPPWGGWDDAVCLVFDGGVRDASILDDIVKQAREIRSAEFCAYDEIQERCADFTARRIEAALANVSGGGPSYTESGRQP